MKLLLGVMLVLLALMGVFGTGPTEVSGQQVTATATAAPTPTPAATPSPSTGTILSGSVPVSGFGLITWGGGTPAQLVTAAGCTEPTLTFWFTSRGNFVTFVPGTTVSAVNAAFTVLHGSSIPPLTPILTRCTEPGALDGYKSASYGIGRAVQLTNGVSEVEAAPGSASKIVTRIFGNEAFGDLTADGRMDVGFVMTQNLGGSGTFYYAAVATRSAGGGWVGTNGVLLGDRIAPQTTEIRAGILIVNYADRKPGEPFTTQPSMGVTKYLRVVNGVLVESSAP